MTNQRLFVSHTSQDEAVVQQIVAYLETHGVPCWIASRDIPPRSIYAEAITEGIRNSLACAVVVSEAANTSKAVKRELELAAITTNRSYRSASMKPNPELASTTTCATPNG